MMEIPLRFEECLRSEGAQLESSGSQGLQWTRASLAQAAFAAVTLTGGVDERQIARLAHRFAGLWISIQKPLFQCDQQAFRDADPGETTGGQGIAIADQSDRFGGGDLLAFFR